MPKAVIATVADDERSGPESGSQKTGALFKRTLTDESTLKGSSDQVNENSWEPVDERVHIVSYNMNFLPHT